MNKRPTYSLPRAKVLRGYAEHARYLATLSDDPVAYVARADVADIPSPYAYSPSKGIFKDAAGDHVVIFETSHAVYEAFYVPEQPDRPGQFPVFKSRAAAETRHMARTR